MFDERTLQAYRSIAAPPGLKEKVLAQEKRAQTVEFKSKKRSGRLLRQLSAAAACLVLIAGVWTVGRQSGSETGFSVHASVTDPAEQSIARMTTGEVVGVEVEISQGSEIACSAGELSVQDMGDSVPVSAGQSCSTEAEALVFWQISAAHRAETYEMTVRGPRDTVTVKLFYDTAKDCWTVSFAES